MSTHLIRFRRGLGLVETLVSLAITASLLTAVAAAFSASAASITMNDQFARATQAARVSVNRVMAEVRKCQSGVVETQSLELSAYDGSKNTYAFDSANKKLTVTVDGITPQTYTMASNVHDITFQTDGKTISMTVVVKIGDNRVVLNGSAFPRRSMTYE